MTLRPVEFHILLALAADERHGYACCRRSPASPTASCSSSPARSTAPCTACSRTAGSPNRPGGRRRTQDDERRRYYRLTPRGPPRRVGGGGAALAPRHRRARAQVVVPCLTSSSHAEPVLAGAARESRAREGGPAVRLVAGLAVSAARSGATSASGLVDALDDRMRARRAAGASTASASRLPAHRRHVAQRARRVDRRRLRLKP